MLYLNMLPLLQLSTFLNSALFIDTSIDPPSTLTSSTTFPTSALVTPIPTVTQGKLNTKNEMYYSPR